MKYRKSFNIGDPAAGRAVSHDQALADMGVSSHRVTGVRLPVHDPATGRPLGMVDYEIDGGPLAKWRAHVERLTKENAELRRMLAALSDDERLAEGRRARRRNPNYFGP